MFSVSGWNKRVPKDTTPRPPLVSVACRCGLRMVSAGRWKILVHRVTNFAHKMLVEDGSNRGRLRKYVRGCTVVKTT